MITLLLGIVLLVFGYVFYGKFLSKLIDVDKRRTTPAILMADCVDYVPFAGWKAYIIQFLNIAGLGPIFGAIMGAKYGTSCYLWIVFGAVFAGGVQDFMLGMISTRHEGESVTSIVGRYLGDTVRKVFTVFTLVLMVFLTSIYISQPAELIAGFIPNFLGTNFWVVVIFVYYILATLFPIDKIVGRFYPIIGALLLLMTVVMLISLLIHHPVMPEMWNGFGTRYEKSPIFPMMFVSIACGAISGFHATQSPIISRCLPNEKYGRFVFYGAMITEGFIALVWAAAATAYFGEHGTDLPTAQIVMELSHTWLGKFGGIMTLLCVVAAPVTSGDTVMRSGRLIVADALSIDQKTIRHRLSICIPLSFIILIVLLFCLKDNDGFSIVWRYFSWSNQTLSVFVLWAVTVYLATNRKKVWVSIIPALFMTMVTSTYILIAPEGLELRPRLAYVLGAAFTMYLLFLFCRWKIRLDNHTK